jgi:hypothetical protein
VRATRPGTPVPHNYTGIVDAEVAIHGGAWKIEERVACGPDAAFQKGALHRLAGKLDHGDHVARGVDALAQADSA